ncbi:MULTISPECIES: integrase arm-type DNA-binding domain-containing protein [unclassified Ruegeria]|uniref:tyrosine-type recombinase/integrase n=1 Tax=unclassified Ruegeria TaxID=2625375 RepID=UPI0014890994|nr:MULTISPECIES: integrase arm-type DNA-binding domain-containing protein [unclassified Ruegeria]
MADETGTINEQRLKSGKHPEKALSAAFVRTVSEPGKYNDGHGLILRVDKSGAKRWVQRIVIKGKRTELGLGPLGLVPLAEAREVALENRKIARSGGDPLRAKREAQSVLTFEAATRKVHEIHEPSWRNKKHAAQFLATLQTYAFPRMGRIRVSEVSTADVLAVLQPIWLEKPETARRVRQRIGTVLKWAIAQGWRQDNPAQNIGSALPRQDKTQQHRKSIHYNEVAGFLEAVRSSGALLSTKLALELIILTATRSGEARLAKWDEINLENAIWTIPADRMKAKKEHRVPFSPRALVILEQAKQLDDGSGLVFPATKVGRPLSDNTLSKLTRELGYDAHVHGFRTSFMTWAQERTNFPREVSEAALAHTIRDKAEAAYARSDLFEKRRKMMESWAAFLSEREAKVARIG